MYYQYEIYIEPGQQYAIADVEKALKSFKIIEKTEGMIALHFGDWKLWVYLSEGDNVTNMASDLARYHNKPEIAKSKARLEMTTDYDDNEAHYHDHLYVLEALAVMESVHVYDPLQDEFRYEKQPAEAAPKPDLRMELLDALEGNPEYADKVELLRFSPYYVRYWEELEELMEEAGNEEFQLDCLHNLLTLCPWDFVPWFNSGILYRDMGDYKTAEGYFRKVTELEPGFSDAWADLGKLYFRKGKTAEALQYIDKAISARKDNDLPYVNAGYYLVKLGEPQKALEYSEAGIAYDRYCCTFNKAHALLALGRQEEAVEFYRQGLQAAKSEQAFKNDFKDDFVIFKKYGIEKAEYNNLLPRIVG